LFLFSLLWFSVFPLCWTLILCFEEFFTFRNIKLVDEIKIIIKISFFKFVFAKKKFILQVRTLITNSFEYNLILWFLLDLTLLLRNFLFLSCSKISNVKFSISSNFWMKKAFKNKSQPNVNQSVVLFPKVWVYSLHSKQKFWLFFS
jgi:hypothetical protein